MKHPSGLPPVFRYEDPEYPFSLPDAVAAILKAVRRRYRHVLEELRDLPAGEHEGVHVRDASEIARDTELLLTHGLGTLYRVSPVLMSTADVPAGTGAKETLPGSHAAVIVEGVTGGEPCVAIFIPPAIDEWAIRWHLGTPSLEAQAVLVRSQWRRNPKAAKKCELIFSALPAIVGTRHAKLPTEAQWNGWGSSTIGANPIIESLPAFVERARAHYQARERLYYTGEPDKKGIRPFVLRTSMRERQRHADWLVRVQVGGESPADVARRDGVEQRAVYQAVRRLARFVNLTLRPLPKTGRPPGRRELHVRHRAHQK